MNDKPILMQGEMVRATLEGRKTQTRRVVNPQPPHENCRFTTILESTDKRNDGKHVWLHADRPKSESKAFRNPYGQPGDLLWVRETWKYSDWTEDGMPWIRYSTDGQFILHEGVPDEWGEKVLDIWADLSDPDNYSIDNRAADRRWRPSIHMPRWASRLTLLIEDVRVERVQDITVADAAAEGCEWPAGAGADAQVMGGHEFADLWDSINAKRGYGWDANPWVWVIEYRAIEANVDDVKANPERYGIGEAA
jgi:hypothetical protein